MCHQFVVDENHHLGSHPSLALATVCVDPNSLVVASVVPCDVDEVGKERPLIKSNFTVNLPACSLFIRSVSFPDVVAFVCFFSFV